MGGIGGLAGGTDLGPVGVGDSAGVGCPGQLGDVLRVVFNVGGELAGGLARAAEEEVVASLGMLDPGEEAAGGSGGQVRGVGRAQNLFKGERLRRLSERGV